MKKTENALEITLLLPTTFAATVEQDLEEEYATACKKWKLQLNSEEKARILELARKQLEVKVSSIARHPWKLSQETLVVMVSTTKKGIFKISLPSDEAANYSVSLVRSHDEWKVDQDPTPESIELNSFADFFLQEVRTWARTAVFYGVGSYS